MNSSPLDPTALPHRSVRLLKREPNGSAKIYSDSVSREEPLSIRLQGVEIATTMRTPGNDEELTTGFLFTENIIRFAQEITSLKHPAISRNPQNQIDVELESPPLIRTPQRYGTISSSCGLCGTSDLSKVYERFPPLDQKTLRIPSEKILELPNLMREKQQTFDSTGGLHAAAIFDGNLNLLCLKEDVGRHNAVDKSIGWALQQSYPHLDQSLLLVSGRISYEIVLKALAARIPVIIGISAPTSLALDFAQSSGITLIGFLRPPTFNLYTHIERIQF